MKLLTKEMIKRFKEIGNQEEVHQEEVLLICKFFCPWNNWSWYASEYDSQTRIFFGYVEGHECEWGYFSLSELESVQGPAGLTIERDLYFSEIPFKKLRE